MLSEKLVEYLGMANIALETQRLTFNGVSKRTLTQACQSYINSSKPLGQKEYPSKIQKTKWVFYYKY